MAELTTAQQIAAGMPVNSNIVSITAPNPSGDSSRIGISNPAAASSATRAGIVSSTQSWFESQGMVLSKDSSKLFAPPTSAAVTKGQDVALDNSFEAWSKRNVGVDPYANVGGEKRTRYSETEMQAEYANLYSVGAVPASQESYEKWKAQNVAAGIYVYADAELTGSVKIENVTKQNFKDISSGGSSSITPTIKNQFTTLDPKVWGLGAPTTANLPSGGSNTANFMNLVPTGASTEITPRVRSITYTPSSYETRGMQAYKNIDTVVGKEVATITPSIYTFSRDIYESNPYSSSVVDKETKQPLKDLTFVTEGNYNVQQNVDKFLSDNPDFLPVSTAAGVVLTRDMRVSIPDVKITSTYNPAPTEGFKTGEGSKLELTPNTYNEYFADQFKRDVQAARNVPVVSELLAGSQGLGNLVRENTAESFALMPMINLLPKDIKTSVSKGLAGYTGDVLAQTGEMVASPATFFAPLAYNFGAKLNYETYNVPASQRGSTLATNILGTTALVGLGATSFMAASTEGKIATVGGVAYGAAVYLPSAVLGGWIFGAGGMSLGKGIDYTKTKYAQYKVAKEIRGTDFQIQTSSADIEYGKLMTTKENANFLLEGTQVRQPNALSYMDKNYKPDITQDLFYTKNPYSPTISTEGVAQGKLLTVGKIITSKGKELDVNAVSNYDQIFEKPPISGGTTASPFRATSYDAYPEFASVNTNIQITEGGKPIYNYEGLTTAIYGGKTGELGYTTGIAKGAAKGGFEFYQVSGTNPTIGQTSQLGNIRLNYKGTYTNENTVNTIFFNQGAPIGAKPVAADFGIVFQEAQPLPFGLYPETVVKSPTGYAPFKSPFKTIIPEAGTGAVVTSGGEVAGTSSSAVASGDQFLVQLSGGGTSTSLTLTGKEIAKAAAQPIKEKIIKGYTDVLLKDAIGTPNQYEAMLSGVGTKAGYAGAASSSFAPPTFAPQISMPRIKELSFTNPMTSPFTTPKFEPITSPKVVPATEPKITPFTVPTFSPVTSPFTVPVTTPVTMPVITPITTPMTTPITMPVTTPMTVPKTTPMPNPFTTPTFAPVRYPPIPFLPSAGGGGGGKMFNPFRVRAKPTRATPSFFAAFTQGSGKASKAPKGSGGLDFGVFTRGLGGLGYKARKKKKGRK